MPYPKLPPYAWPDGKSSAVCFTIDVDAEAPYLWANRSSLPDRLSQLEIRKFGPRRGLWRLAEMLDGFGIKGSFYVPGAVAELHPEILPGLADSGHEVGLHGWLHELVRDNPTHDEFCRALDRSLEIFHQQIGRAPAGFRSPAWEMTPAMIAEVKKRGLLYDSSLMGFDHPYEIDGLIEVPVQWATDDAIFFKFLGGGADHWPPAFPEAVGAAWLQEWRRGHEENALFMLTVHPWISGRPQKLEMLEVLLRQILAKGDVWCATAGEIADYHRASPNKGRFTATSDLTAERRMLEVDGQ